MSLKNDFIKLFEDTLKFGKLYEIIFAYLIENTLKFGKLIIIILVEGTLKSWKLYVV